MIGAFIGWKMVPVAIILSAVVGLVIAALLIGGLILLRRRIARR